MKLSEDDQSKHVPNIQPIDHWIVGLPINNPSFLHASMGAQVGFFFDEPPIWRPLSLEGKYLHDGILTI